MSEQPHSAIRALAVRLLVVVACVAGISSALMVAHRYAAAPVVPDARAPGAPHAAAPSTIPKPLETQASADEPRTVRDVTPGGIARIFMTPAPPAKRRAAASIRITEAGVKPDGSIVGEGGNVRLYGVAFPEPRRVCKTAAGESWPCGRRAYITLHNRIAAETVSCEPRADADPPAADCFVGNLNLAAWMLGQGLARLAADVSDEGLVAAEAAARKAKLGLWDEPGEAAPVSARRQ
jgi:endonuclease YncB( thermonuclease family)